jgi:hypothetical protein
VVEVARLESVYRFIAYPGFESPSLRQKQQKAPMTGLFYVCSPRIYSLRLMPRVDSPDIRERIETFKILHFPSQSPALRQWGGWNA